MSKGKILVITGTDGSGKATQTNLLYEFLKANKYKVEQQSFPNYKSVSAGPIKLYLNGNLSKSANEISSYQASVLFAVDRFCTMKIYKKFLDNGGILLLDRYIESNLIHQIGKIKGQTERNTYIKWLEDFEYNLLGIPKPDLVVFLDMPPNFSIQFAQKRVVLKNGESQDIHEKDTNHLVNAYANAKKISKMYKWPVVKCVDKNAKLKSIEEINKEVIEIVLNYLSKQEKNNQ